jgi:hypothetical protein
MVAHSSVPVTAVTVECRLQAVERRLQRIESLQDQLMTIAQDGNERRRQRKGVLVGSAAPTGVLLIFIAYTSNRRLGKRGRRCSRKWRYAASMVMTWPPSTSSSAEGSDS